MCEVLKAQLGLSDAELRKIVLRLPPVLISVTGGADAHISMPDRLALVFRRGLLAVATRTKAWIVTGGTAAGVMAMVTMVMTAMMMAMVFVLITTVVMIVVMVVGVRRAP